MLTAEAQESPFSDHQASMSKQISISELMTDSGVAFGTSGARGLVTRMTDLVCYAYTRAFLSHLEQSGQIREKVIAIGGDLRPSSDRIQLAAALAVSHMGPDYRVVNCDKISSPALALYGMQNNIPTVMITGSHIPDDRNGIKFTTPKGEITKLDEAGIKAQVVAIPAGVFNQDGMVSEPIKMQDADVTPRFNYIDRYVEFFGRDFLQSVKVGVYQHSAVLRDDIIEIYRALGADVTPLGRSETFMPVDTEAIRPEDISLAREWAKSGDFDAIVSMDGDSDRPLISDERGNWLRGDVAGVLVASYVQATSVATPVSSNSALESCGKFQEVRRTKIGSPFVIAAMEEAKQADGARVVGYEANGGFLLGFDLERDGKQLAALPTRDAVIVHLAILGLAKQEGKTIGQLLQSLPARYTHSDRLKDFPTSASKQLIAALVPDDFNAAKSSIEAHFGALCGKVASIDRTDGSRITFENGEVLHFRPSGNAPEMRCYSEAASVERAVFINRDALDIMKALAGLS